MRARGIEVTGEKGKEWRNGWEEVDEKIAHVYTDGSGQLGKKENGRKVEEDRAGWGFAAWRAGVEINCWGEVGLRMGRQEHMGAERATNNMWEVTAIIKASKWRQEEGGGTTTLVTHYDSEYAANMAKGLWRLRRNVVLIKRARKELEEARKKREVHFVHVKGQCGDIGNDKVDVNAERGKEGGERGWGEVGGRGQEGQEGRRRIRGKTPRHRAGRREERV